MIEYIMFFATIGIITLMLYFMNPKTFKDKRGSVIIYLGCMFAYFGFMWFGIIVPGTKKGIEQATPEELAEIEVFISNAIFTMIVVMIGIVLFTIFLTWYFNKKNHKMLDGVKK